MVSVTACPVGETIPIADGVCLDPLILDPASGCCAPGNVAIIPNVIAGNVLEIPSIAPAPFPAPVEFAAPGVVQNRIIYSGSPANPRGLPATAGTGFAAAIPILSALLGSVFALLIQKFEQQNQNQPKCSVRCGAGETQNPAPDCRCIAPACATPPPCRPTEQLDHSGKCCTGTTHCPSGEFPQPCRATESVDAVTGCCQTAAAVAL